MAPFERPPAALRGSRHSGRAQLDAISDPYQMQGKIPEPASCPQCGAVYLDGRWTWSQSPAAAEKVLCQACRRTNDRFPAGIVTLMGEFAIAHKEEILNLVRNLEQAEKSDHPANRIIDIEEAPDRIVINTTDIHLPRRIGEACKRAFKGKLTLSYDEDGYFVRVDWQREGSAG